MSEIPVYVTCGFLESGKTGFIRGILEDHQFTELKKSLVIACEEGIEEYDDDLLEESNASLVTYDSLAALNRDEFRRLARPKMVFIEVNGMWNLEELLPQIPKNMPVVQIFTMIDATTYEVYMANMRSLIMTNIKHSDVAIVNRCTADTKKASMRRTIKGANPRCMVMYENAEGVSSDEVEDDLPFDFNAPVMDIEEADFGVWYLDVMETPHKYATKTVRFKCQVYYDDEMPDGYFYGGRYAMTCCEADIQYVGVMVRWKDARKIAKMGYVWVEGKVSIEANEMYTAPGPVVTASAVIPAEDPSDRLVYFS